MFLSSPVKKIKHYVEMWNCLVILLLEIFFSKQTIAVTEVEISFTPSLTMSVMRLSRNVNNSPDPTFILPSVAKNGLTAVATI